MKDQGKKLKVGDFAMTDFNDRKNMIKVKITERRHRTSSESKVLLRVDPAMRGGDLNTWYDSNWFYPIKDEK